MSFLDKLAAIDRRYLYAILIVLITIPLVRPLGIPIGNIGKETRDFYDAVEAMSAGDIAILGIDFRPEAKAEGAPQAIAFVKHAFAKGVRVIAWSGLAEGAALTQTMIEPVAESMDKVYGVDWINLGFKPSTEVNLQRMVNDFPGAVAYSDIFGNSLDEYPIMDGFDSIVKADVLVSISNVVPGPDKYAKMITLPENMKMLAGIGSTGATQQLSYYTSGTYLGLLAGSRGGAEYEMLLQSPGMALAGMDAQSMAHLFIIVLIILGNLGDIFNRKNQKSQAKGGGR